LVITQKNREQEHTCIRRCLHAHCPDALIEVVESNRPVRGLAEIENADADLLYAFTEITE
jgi:hypothetical protein